jgi:hypothetical protein
MKELVFTVINVSTNRNAFGLYGHKVVDETGREYEILFNYLRKRNVGSRLNVPVGADSLPQWSLVGAECPREIGRVPLYVLDNFFPDRRDYYELIRLRVSIARMAQKLQVKDCLPVDGKNYNELIQMAFETQRGWNKLVAACMCRLDS